MKNNYFQTIRKQGKFDRPNFSNKRIAKREILKEVQ